MNISKFVLTISFLCLIEFCFYRIPNIHALEVKKEITDKNISNNQIKKIESHDYYLPYLNKGNLYLKEKSIKSNNSQKNKVLVLLPPLSLPSGSAFDVPEISFMDHFAKLGYSVWSVDFLNQGRSTFQKEMLQNPPVSGIFPLSAKESAEQLKVIINFIKNQKNVDEISLLGWSWGAVVAGLYAEKSPSDLNKLILVGAMHAFHLPKFTKPFADNRNEFNERLPAYQFFPWAALESHWQSMADGKKVVSEKNLQLVKETFENIDKDCPIKGSVRRGNGAMKDLFYIWTNRSVYGADKIKTETLVIYGSRDLFSDPKLFTKLTNAKQKKEIIIPDATHWVFYEENREVLFNNIDKFLKQN